jgi:ABC-type nitrate/sulfonate/bicarbonate transport system substrate-binding protein
MEGFFAQEQIEIDPVFFRSGAELVPALSTGQIDLAATSPGAALYNALGAGVAAKIVGDYFVLSPEQPGGDPNAVTVRKDHIDSGRVKTPADVKGMTMAITARGQVTDLTAGLFLQKAGLTEKDVRIVTMPYPDMLAAFQGKAIDVAVAIDPQITIAEEQGIAKRFMKLSDLMRPPIWASSCTATDWRRRIATSACASWPPIIGAISTSANALRHPAGGPRSRRSSRNISPSRIRRCTRRSVSAWARKAWR